MKSWWFLSLRVAGWSVVDTSVVDVPVVVGRGEALSAAVGIGFIVCLCPEHSLSSGEFAG